MKVFHSLNDTVINEKTAVALGYFDSVHIGHKAVINGAVGSRVPSAVFTFIGAKNGEKPILTDKEKENKISELGIKYYLCIPFSEICDMSGDEFFKTVLVEKMNACKLYCGGDFRFGKDAKWGVDELKILCENYGVELNIVPFIYYNNEKISTTVIRKLLNDGNTLKAKELL